MGGVESRVMSAREMRLSSLDRVHDLRFDRVRLPVASALGGDWKQWLEVVDGAKIIVGAWAVGAARAALEMAGAYAKVREQFNRPIGSFQAVQHRLADAAIAVEQATGIVRYAAWLRGGARQGTRGAAQGGPVGGGGRGPVDH